MIRVLIIRNPFEPAKRETIVEEAGRARQALDLLPQGIDPSDIGVWRNGSPSNLYSPVVDGDWFAFVVRPRDFTGVTLATVLAGVLVSAAVSLAIMLLFPPPGPPKSRSDEDSPTYGFSGISNIRSEGLPIAVIYGKVRVGGTVISEFTRVRNIPPDTVLYTLISFGEGPVYAIGSRTSDSTKWLSVANGDLPTGIKVEDNQGENYPGIEAQVRMGTNEQEPIEEFHEIQTAFSVEQVLGAATTIQADNSGFAYGGLPGSANFADFFTTAGDSTFDLYKVSFSFAEEFDGAVIRLRCESGLFRAESDGDLIGTNFYFQPRYIELDSGGVPITTGGPLGDGYVRLPPLILTGIVQRGALEVDHTIRFFDKANYVPPALGKALDVENSGGANQHATAARNGSFPFAVTDSVDVLTIECWFFPESLPTPAAAGETIHLFGNYTNTDRRGVSLCLRSSFNFLQSQFTFVAAARLQVGTSDTTDYIYADYEMTIVVGTWNYIALTFQKDASGTNEQVELYWNGEAVRHHIAPVPLVWGASTHYWGRNAVSLATYNFDGQMDDTLLFHREISATEIRQRYSNGAGVYGTIGTELRSWWTWDIDGRQQLTSGHWMGDATLVNGATAGTAAGHILSGESGTLKRARYRVDCVRVNPDSTHNLVQDDAKWGIAFSILDELLSYPNEPLLALKIPASKALNTTIPRITCEVQGMVVPIWNRDSTEFPTFHYAWSANPAWVALDIATNKRYGLGRYYALKDIDLEEHAAWADYCDEVVYDGTAQIGPDIGGEWEVLYYFNDTQDDDGDTRGSLWIVFDISPQTVSPPSDWKVGDFVRFHGVQQVGANPEINQGEFGSNTSGGYEIKQIMYGGTHGAVNLGNVWIVEVYWDRLLTDGDPWTSGQRHDTVFGSATTGLSTGGERRFEFNGAFDAQMPAWDALIEAAKVGRAVPIRDGRKLRFKFARPRTPLAPIGMGSLGKGSFKIGYRGGKSSPNALEIGFLDRELDYERSTADAVHRSVGNDQGIESLRREHTFMPFVTSRGQVIRAGLFQTNMYQDLVRHGSFRLGPEALHFEPGDVVRLAHDILPRTLVESGGRRYAEMVSGRALTDAPGADQLVSDRDFHIDGTKVYILYWWDKATDSFNAPRVHEPTTGVGPHLAGDSIYMVTGDEPPDPIPKGTPFILCVEGEHLDVEIGRITLEDDKSRAIEFVEYLDIIYDDELDELTQDTLLTVGGGGTGGLVDILPLEPTITSVDDFLVRNRSGVFTPMLRVSWSHELSTLTHVGATAIFLSKDGQTWRQVYAIDGTATEAEFPVQEVETGDRLFIALQTRSHAGKRLDPIACPKRRHTFIGIGAYPGAPANLAANMVDDKVVYTWTLPAGQEGNRVECRRGGWILAPVVFLSERGALSFGPTRDWSGATVGSPTLYFRCRNEIGQYSEAVTLSFSPTPPVHPVAHSQRWNDQAWEAFGTGWVQAVPPAGDPFVTDLQVTSGYLEFAGSALTATYTIGDPDNPATIATQLPRESFLEAAVVAEQVHPLTWDMAEFGWGDEKNLRWTWEGPTHLLPGEIANCTITIQVRVNTSGAAGDWSAWLDFRPGLVSIAAAQFRLVVTRPNTSYQVKIHSFRTRVRQRRTALTRRSTYDTFLRGEVYA